MANQERGEFRQYVESDGNRADLYFSARTSALMGVAVLAAALVTGSELLFLSGAMIFGAGLVLVVFFLRGYLEWRAYCRRLPPSVSGA